MTLVLQGRRLRLQSFGPADIGERYLGWLNDPEVVRFSNQRFVRHDGASCERYLRGFAGTPNLFFSVRDGRSGEAVGTLTAYRAPAHGSADIGILIGERSAWGQGIGLDAFGTLADWLATQPGMRKLSAGTLAANHGMVRVAERAGFALEATRHAHELLDGTPCDLLLYARFVPTPMPATPTADGTA